ncbi:S1 family peptidase [Amycolatopsis balhimycina]|uniref:S1 family peptidase n=1 Tax=Amycolatopsis balhimycina TaxID=208443 RepID=UPI001FDECB26|nr:trypsin-like serine protease [Amycolatopsis balhimycina]
MRTIGIACTVAALVLPGLLGASTASAAQPEIVGGSAATGDTSWVASMVYDAPAYGRFAAPWCGGALVFRSWVVTNAHCVTDMPGDTTHIPVSARTFTVRVGSKDRTRGGETARVVEIKVHPGWQWAAGAPEQPVDDIALLKLDHPVTVQPIQLAGHTARPGDRATLYGWGADQPDGDTSNLPVRLQQLRTTVLAPERCADAGQSAGEICTNNPHGTDGPGGGDSGGPAVALVDGVPQLVGTCSRAAAQYPGVSPTVYTSAPDFRTWLYDTARGTSAAAA